jgi:hypothetical protein
MFFSGAKILASSPLKSGENAAVIWLDNWYWETRGTQLYVVVWAHSREGGWVRSPIYESR